MEKRNTNKYLFIGLVVLFAIVGVWFIMMQKNTPNLTPPVGAPTAAGTSTSQANVKAFTVTGTNYSYDPAEIKVSKGDRVRITFNNMEGFHNLTVDGYNMTTKTISAGSQDTIEFTADKAGTYQYFCTVDSHKDKGMVGNFIVN